MSTATLTITATDPQQRVQRVEFNTQADEETESGWYDARDEIAVSGVTVTVDDETVTVGQENPWSATVDYVETATIQRRYTYLDVSGTVVTKTKTYTYPVQTDYVTVAGVPITASAVLVTTRRR